MDELERGNVDRLDRWLLEQVAGRISNACGGRPAPIRPLRVAGRRMRVHGRIGQEPDAHGRSLRISWSVPSKRAYMTSDRTVELNGSPPGVAMIANRTIARIAHRRRADRKR